MSSEERLVILLNDNVKMSRGKAAAQAVHAALMAYGIDHGSVVVLGGGKRDLGEMPIQVRDAGRTEVEPGTLTAGARIENGGQDSQARPGGSAAGWLAALGFQVPAWHHHHDRVAMGHRQKGKGGKRKRSWHRRGAGPDWAWMRAVERLEGAAESAACSATGTIK